MAIPKHLQRIGMGVFISEYEFFATKPKQADAIAYLVDKGISNDAGAGHRVSGAKCLFDDHGLLREALEYICLYFYESNCTGKRKGSKIAQEPLISIC